MLKRIKNWLNDEDSEKVLDGENNVIKDVSIKLNILNNLYFNVTQQNEKEVLFYLKSKMEFIIDKRKKKKLYAYILSLADSEFSKKDEIKKLIHHDLSYMNHLDVIDMDSSITLDRKIQLEFENNDVSKHETKLFFLKFVVENFSSNFDKKEFRKINDEIADLALQVFNIACAELEIKQIFNQDSLINQIAKMRRELYN